MKYRLLKFTLLTLGMFCTAAPCLADDPAPDAQPQTTNASKNLPISDALNAPPPERPAIGRAWAHDQTRLDELDAWIQNTAVDAPKNLVMRDLLLAMPIQVSGPKLVALAKKSNDSAVQASWKRYLQAYPAPYASVLASWTLAASGNPTKFLTLLNEYATLQPDSALKLWSSLIENNTVASLDRVADYGLRLPGAQQALESRLSNDQLDETKRLRLYRAITRSVQTQGLNNNFKNREQIEKDVTSLLSHEAVSRRIVALDVAGALKLSALEPKISERYQVAKNTTERAHALRAMLLLDAPSAKLALSDALSLGDEVLRLEAANALANDPDRFTDIPKDTIQSAFEKEIWPETQVSLYHALKARTPDPNLSIDVMKNGTLTDAVRQAAVQDLTSSPQDAASLSLNDLADLQRNNAPLDIIATTAEVLYTHHPESRPKLQTWISVQRPFERRLLTTFARFIQVDKINSNQTQNYVRDVCSHAPEEENILQPCIAYLEDHASTENDKELLTKLKARQKQFDIMMDL